MQVLYSSVWLFPVEIELGSEMTCSVPVAYLWLSVKNELT